MKIEEFIGKEKVNQIIKDFISNKLVAYTDPWRLRINFFDDQRTICKSIRLGTIQRSLSKKLWNMFIDDLSYKHNKYYESLPPIL